MMMMMPSRTMANAKDMLVPTTVSNHSVDYEDVGYVSDDKGFYGHFDDKSGQTSLNVSGTSTPTNYSDNTMDPFDTFANNWNDDLMPTMSPSQLHINLSSEQSTGQQLPNQQQFNQQLANQQQFNQQLANQQLVEQQFARFEHVVSEALDYNRDDADSSEESGEEDHEQEDNADLPDILRRPVKGMTVEEKKLRRRELNRLAARRSRQKKKSTADTYEQDVGRLTQRNAELKSELSVLESARIELFALIKNHFKQCNPNNMNNHHHNNSNKAVGVQAKRTKPGRPAVAASCGFPKTVAAVGVVGDFYPSSSAESSFSQEFSVSCD